MNETQPETVTLTKEQYDGIVAVNHQLAAQVEMLGGCLRLALSMLEGPLVFTTTAREDAIDTSTIQIVSARKALSPADALNVALTAKVDLDETFLAMLTPKPEAEALPMKMARAEAREKRKALLPKKEKKRGITMLGEN